MANTYLKRTGTTTVNTYTFSAWIKLGTLSSANNTYQVLFSSGNQNILGIYGGPTASGYNALYHYNNTNLWWTNNLLRDPNSWYHVLAKVSGGTVTTYINGVQTSYATSTYSLGALETTTDKTCVGCYAPSASSFFRGSMSHVHFISGTAYDPSAFGETDTTTGEWKAKTSPSVTYGADGFFILKDGNGITDQSGEGNNFTLGGGTLTDLKDNPDNTFATFNPLFVYSSGKKPAYSNGNNTATFDNSGENEHSPSTLAPSSGKYYAEFKWVSSHGNAATGVGIFATDVNINTDINAQSYLYMGNGQKRILNSSSSYGASWTTGDIISIALDCDNNTVTYYKNGASQGAISIASDKNYYMYCTDYDNKVVNANFGNGYFGTTAITTNSGNGYAGAEGASKFNYTVPTGYSALSTKGLNE